jgi:MoxR-like ATPase
MSLESAIISEKEKNPIHTTKKEVSYLGVTLEKAGNRGNAPDPDDYKDYIDDQFSLELQKKIAASFLEGDPILIEGGTSIGKTTTVKKMCAELGWEVHYVNLNGATDVEDLMGRYVPNHDKNKPKDPEYIFADGKVTSGLRQEEGKTKVIILDELNASAPNILIRLHEVLDALERGGKVVLLEDASESITVSKVKTKVVALMNPPGRGYLQREALDPAQLRRWVYQKEVTDLPKATFSNSVDVLFGLAPQHTEVPKTSYLSSNDARLSQEMLSEIPGIREIVEKYKEFHEAAKELVKNRSIADDQPQPFTYDDRVEQRRVRNFVSNFYKGDITKTFQDALRYYYVGKVLELEDKEKLEELIALVEYVPARTESKRKGLPAEGEKKETKQEIEYFAKTFGEGNEKIIPGQLVKDVEGTISVFVGLSKEDGAPVLRPYEGKESSASADSVETPEGIKIKQKAFLKETFGIWGIDKDKVDKVEPVATLEDPKKVKTKDWDDLKADIKPEKFGEYTLNPEMATFSDADFEQMVKTGKVKVEKLPDEYNGKPLAEVASYIMKTYGDRYHIPGIEYWQCILANPDKSPESLKDGNYHFLFGGKLRGSRGRWCVPYVRWSSDEWDSGAGWLGGGWDSGCRVVLLEK